MSDDTGAGRRHNPFPSLSETEYDLFLATIREAVAAGVAKAFSSELCPRPCARVNAIEATVFGRTERGVVGLDDRVRSIESFVVNVRRLTWLAVGATISAIASLVVAIAAFAATH